MRKMYSARHCRIRSDRTRSDGVKNYGDSSTREYDGEVTHQVTTKKV